MVSKRNFLNYAFVWGIALFHVYVLFNWKANVAVTANLAMPSAAGSSDSQRSGCPLKMARSLFKSAFVSNSLLVGRPVHSGAVKHPALKTTTINGLIDLRVGQDILGYVHSLNDYSSYRRRFELFAKTEPMPGSTSTVLPAQPPAADGVAIAEAVEGGTEKKDKKDKKKKKKRQSTEALEVVVLGLSHHNAKVEVREKLAIPEDEWNDASTMLCQYDSISEASVLSTCNRFEIYLAGKNQYECMRDAIDFLYARADGSLDLSTLRRNLFMLSGEDAIWHLLRVSAGLDSLVVGEGQILSQVKKAYEHSIEATGQGGKVIARMLNTAVSSGKRVRSETGISKGAVSISSAAAEFTAFKLKEDCNVDSMSDAVVTIIGAGKMARLLIIHLQTQGVTSINIVNRSKPRVEELQAEFPDLKINMYLMDDMWDVVRQSDVVYPSTAATTTIIDPEPLKEALARGRGDRPGGVQFVDISVPRNVHPDCETVPGAFCYNVDDLKAVVERNTAKRRREMIEAENILKEEQDKFRLWQQSLGAIPTIAKLQEKAETLRREEMIKASKKLGALSDKDLETVEKVTKGIVAKLLHGPMNHLRQQKEGDATRAAILQVQQAFQLEESNQK